MARQSALSVDGLNEFRAALKAMNTQWGKELGEANKIVSDYASEWARDAAGSGTKQQASSADSIKGSSSQVAARITIGRGTPYALGAFYGAKRRSGWFSDIRYKQSAGKQFQPWVGSAWQVATATGGPYQINASLHEHLPDILELYGRMIDAVAARAFPQ